MTLYIWNSHCSVVLSKFLTAQDDSSEITHIYIWNTLPPFKCHYVFLDIKKGGSIFFQHIAMLLFQFLLCKWVLEFGNKGMAYVKDKSRLHPRAYWPSHRGDNYGFGNVRWDCTVCACSACVYTVCALWPCHPVCDVDFSAWSLATYRQHMCLCVQCIHTHLHMHAMLDA